MKQKTLSTGEERTIEGTKLPHVGNPQRTLTHSSKPLILMDFREIR